MWRFSASCALCRPKARLPVLSSQEEGGGSSSSSLSASAASPPPPRRGGGTGPRPYSLWSHSSASPAVLVLPRSSMLLLHSAPGSLPHSLSLLNARVGEGGKEE